MRAGRARAARLLQPLALERRSAVASRGRVSITRLSTRTRGSSKSSRPATTSSSSGLAEAPTQRGATLARSPSAASSSQERPCPLSSFTHGIVVEPTRRSGSCGPTGRHRTRRWKNGSDIITHRGRGSPTNQGASDHTTHPRRAEQPDCGQPRMRRAARP